MRCCRDAKVRFTPNPYTCLSCQSPPPAIVENNVPPLRQACRTHIKVHPSNLCICTTSVTWDSQRYFGTMLFWVHCMKMGAVHSTSGFWTMSGSTCICCNSSDERNCLSLTALQLMAHLPKRLSSATAAVSRSQEPQPPRETMSANPGMLLKAGSSDHAGAETCSARRGAPGADGECERERESGELLVKQWLRMGDMWR